jgi:hypothetical protein
MADAALDFNSHTMREAAASDAINATLDAALQRKRGLQERRPYVGASAIGYSCERKIQFDYAGAEREKGFKAETLRKFDFGHMGEELARAWFFDAGFELVQKSQRTGEMFRFSQMDGRFKGHPDGVFVAGPKIEGVGYPCLWETKSVGAKTYREIAKHGLKKSRPAYYAQVAIYQAYLDLQDHPCIFTVTNLDSGEQLHLLIPFDAEEAQRMSDRAVRIIGATDAGELLPRPFADRDYFECKWCDFRERCWGLDQ